MLLLRVICYAALAIVVFGAIALFAPFILGLCQNASGGTIKCTDPTYRWFFETGFTIVMMSIFTGVPSLLALGGIGFAIRDVLFRPAN